MLLCDSIQYKYFYDTNSIFDMINQDNSNNRHFNSILILSNKSSLNFIIKLLFSKDFLLKNIKICKLYKTEL